MSPTTLAKTPAAITHPHLELWLKNSKRTEVKMFTIQRSHTARKALDKLPAPAIKKILTHLEELKIDPYRPRPKADIVPVEGSETLYRLRVGRLRVEYEVCNKENVIKIAKIFQKKRKSDYR